MNRFDCNFPFNLILISRKNCFVKELYVYYMYIPIYRMLKNYDLVEIRSLTSVNLQLGKVKILI